MDPINADKTHNKELFILLVLVEYKRGFKSSPLCFYFLYWPSRTTRIVDQVIKIKRGDIPQDTLGRRLHPINKITRKISHSLNFQHSQVSIS